MSSWEWWSSARCAAFFDVPVRQFRERMAVVPGFPDAFRPGATGNPRWRSDEVREWSLREHERQAGRLRAAAESRRGAMSDAASR